MRREPGAPDPGRVVLREVVASDLPVFYEHQRDPVAVRMAAFTSRERDAFDAHWERILANPENLVKTVVFDGRVAGNVVSFFRDGHRQVGYWIGRDYWGKGTATRALALFLDIETTRPLFGHVAKTNLRSIRVLQNCGFAVCGEESVPFGGPGETVDDFIMKLEGER